MLANSGVNFMDELAH